MLADARDREARFDSAGASALRQEVLHAFDAALRPSPELREAAFTAMLDMVAGLLGDNKSTAADALAKDAVRSFGEARIDPSLYPPAVRDLVARTTKELRGEPRTTLEIRVDTTGLVYADGLSLGTASEQLFCKLPAGAHRVWLVDTRGRSSLPYPTTLGRMPVRLDINLALDQLVDVEPVISVRCGGTCESALRSLGRRLKVANVLGVGTDPNGATNGILVNVASGESATWKPLEDGRPDLEATEAAITTRLGFSPLYLVPFGVGQFAQERPAFGFTYAATEVGLLAWHLVAWQRHASSVSHRDFVREPALRSQRNLSAGLFYGAIAAGMTEAVVMGLLTGEP